MNTAIIKQLKKLSLKKYRAETGLFLVEGTKSVLDLLRSDMHVTTVYALPAWITAHAAYLPSVPFVAVTDSELARFSCLTTPQEVIAVAECPNYSLDNIDYQQFILVLDGIRDPGNLGTIVRTADWFGIKQIVCSPDCVELTNPKVIQATMGSFTRMPIYYTDLQEFLSSDRLQGQIFGAFMQGEELRSVKFHAGDVVVVGNEGHGISDVVSALVARRISVPAGANCGAESLNASVAAAIVLYEMGR